MLSVLFFEETGAEDLEILPNGLAFISAVSVAFDFLCSEPFSRTSSLPFISAFFIPMPIFESNEWWYGSKNNLCTHSYWYNDYDHMCSMRVCIPVSTLSSCIPLSSTVTIWVQWVQEFPIHLSVPWSKQCSQIPADLSVCVCLCMLPLTYHLDFNPSFYTFWNKPFNFKMLVGHATISRLLERKAPVLSNSPAHRSLW